MKSQYLPSSFIITNPVKYNSLKRGTKVYEIMDTKLLGEDGQPFKRFIRTEIVEVDQETKDVKTYDREFGARWHQQSACENGSLPNQQKQFC